MRLADGDEVSSLYPANEPNSRKGVSGSNNNRTLSRATILVVGVSTSWKRYLIKVLFPCVSLHNVAFLVMQSILTLVDIDPTLVPSL